MIVPRFGLGAIDADSSIVPAANEILQQLARSANDLVALAIAWHVVALIAIVVAIRRPRAIARNGSALAVTPVIRS